MIAPNPEVRGERVLRAAERAFQLADRCLARLGDHHPLRASGALAILSSAVATATGVLLLWWYVPSVGGAYASVVAMEGAPATAGLTRTLHRLSSDAAMVFTLLHLARMVAERRFAGARWWAWITGAASLVVLWAIGWTGYWLVWDQRAHRVAVGTSRMLDVLPVFTEPLSRAFLTDEAVSSLFFFVVFFLHMLLPLPIVAALWLHVSRLSRPRWLPSRGHALAASALMVLAAVAWPAEVAAPARMAEVVQRFTMDWWYLAPLAVTDRLGAGALWAVALVGTGAFLAVPWWGRARRPLPAAAVEVSRCNACRTCFEDCPYDAIAMVSRTDGHPRFLEQPAVDPARCVSCGICAGSCDSAGIGVPWFESIDRRKEVDRWLADEPGARVAFVCGEAFAGEVPGHRTLTLPCAGWLHMLTVERAVRRGASSVLVVTCPPGACRHREGAAWTHDRFAGERGPSLRLDPASPRLRIVAADRSRPDLVHGAAAALAEGRPPSATGTGSRALAALGVAVLAGSILIGSDLGYATPDLVDGSELVVSVRHAGQLSERCRAPTQAELDATPVHMRRAEVCDRSRADVVLHVAVDGAETRRSLRPTGLWRDGVSTAVVRLPVRPGVHRVEVALADGPDGAFTHLDHRELEFTSDQRRVVVFQTIGGFTWH